MKMRFRHPQVVRALAVVVMAAGLSLETVAPVGAEDAPRRTQPGPETSQGGPGSPDRSGDATVAPDGKPAEQTPKDPMSRALGGHIPPTASARAKLLSDLYALLATAEDEAGAKKVQSAIEKVWQRSGSDTVGLLLQRAVKAAGEKKDALAEALFDAAVELAPDYAEAWNRRAFFHYKQNDYGRALGDLRRTLALDPSHFRALEGLATIMRETGDDTGAFKAYERLLEVNPLGEGVQKGYDELKVKVQGRGI
ncbi:MAG: tetratricopeptide repeat protein [Hyphomicrobiaceae bacterium]